MRLSKDSSHAVSSIEPESTRTLLFAKFLLGEVTSGRRPVGLEALSLVVACFSVLGAESTAKHYECHAEEAIISPVTGQRDMRHGSRPPSAFKGALDGLA